MLLRLNKHNKKNNFALNFNKQSNIYYAQAIT